MTRPSPTRPPGRPLRHLRSLRARRPLRLLGPVRPVRPLARLLAPVLLAALAACSSAMGRAAGPPEVVAPEGSRVGALPFSPGVRAGGFIFLSGAIGTRPGTTGLVSDDVGDQTRQALANLETVLQAAGAGLGDVVKCTVFLVDMGDYQAMNRAYAGVWPGAPPARSTVAGSGLALGARVEIECIAYAPAA